jgi:hypothetical protein
VWQWPTARSAFHTQFAPLCSLGSFFAAPCCEWQYVLRPVALDCLLTGAVMVCKLLAQPQLSSFRVTA